MVTLIQYKEAKDWIEKNTNLVESAKKLVSGRNELCSCNSMIKAKKCCLPKIDKLFQSARNAELVVKHFEYANRPIRPIVELKDLINDRGG